MENYATEGVGICKSRQFLIDSIAALDSTTSGCGLTPQNLSSSSCLASLGTYSSYLASYLTKLGLDSLAQLSTNQLNDIRTQYLMDSSFCRLLSDSISHSLELTRRSMMSDMVPYSGQYAIDSVEAGSRGTGSMYGKYNIFSRQNIGANSRPYYRNPRLTASGYPNRYYDANGNVDSTALPSLLSGMSAETYTGAFKDSWAESLLPYHPEYPKLKFAEDSLRRVFNFIDSVDITTTAFNVLGSDPFFSTSYATSADKNLIKKYSDTAWINGLSMWQLAYGSVFGCHVYSDTATRKDCYSYMPKVLATVGTTVNNGTGSVTLTSTLQVKAWVAYRSQYRSVRAEMVNRYINTRPTLTDTADYRTLVFQEYFLHFPYNNALLAENLKWTNWFPNSSGVYPVYNVRDSFATYLSPCESYIEGWKAAFAKCNWLDSVPGKTRAQLLDSLVKRLKIVCDRGTDAANAYGSSTVAPVWVGGTYTSFEQVVNNYLDSLGIPKNLYCNPYSINFPKPHGLNPVFAAQGVSTLDSCVCNQYTKLKAQMTANSVNTSSLTAVNSYLSAHYGDTLSQELFLGLGRCGNYYLYSCDTITTTCYGHMGSYPCTQVVCDTLWSVPLLSPQNLPKYLQCGYVDTGCYNCTAFKSLDSSFYARFGKHPVFTGTNLADSVVAWNDLFARYVNFKTGLDNTWQYYANRFYSDSCGIGGLTGNKNTLKICIDSIALNDTTGLLVTVTPCQRVRNQAIIKAGLMYEYYREKALADFKAAYYAQSQLVTESFVAIDTVKEYHYTLYYYDMAGNLIKTVPPKGVNPIWRQTWSDSVNAAKAAGTLLVPTHNLVTRYSYNSLNQVTIQKSPDGGTSRFWYDRLGRLVISQNARQQGMGQVYSYTLYDQFGRITEVGQITGGSAMTETISRDTTSLQSWLSAALSSRTQITKTGYDLPYGYIAETQENGSLYGEYLTQVNLRNRVSYSAVFAQASDGFPTAATYYTYDIHGNVDTLLQDFGRLEVSPNAMNASGQRYKKIVYDFDLVSGKVNQVSYQPGQDDAFYHRYSYDAENRLTDVYTGRDSVQLFLFPEREAHYTYYKHGPLARTDIGQLRVQGQDFVYTLQGWIKGVNPAMGGTLTNGTDTTEAGPTAQDVYGYSLNYYRGDYKAIGYTPQTHTVIGQLSSNGAALYNGNIAAMAVNIPKLGATRLYNYHYDQLNRIVSMDAFSGLDPVAGTFTPVSLSDYQERVTYDPNGNILTYNRHGDAARFSMDSMLYSYTAGTNRLHRVTDYATDASSGTYAQYNDLKQGQSDNNYQYDQIGNLIYDGSEGISNITWNVYGKIETVTKSGTVIRYVYDASGNRIIKKTPTDTTFYVRDASGNVLSVYSRPVAGTLQQAEIHLYGSSRIGMLTTRSAADTFFNLSGGFAKIKGIKFTRGEKLFELSNHLGNVLVAISDRKIAIQNGTTGLNSHYLADIYSAQDYYPFGMCMPGRKYEAQSGYRYGFNGQESSSEISQNTTSALFWEYDSKISRRWNTDPKPNPGVSLYSCFNGSPIQKVDILGDTTRPYFSATRYTRDFKTEITADNTFTFKEAGVKFRAAAYSTKLFDKDYLGYFRPRTIYLVEDKTVINENDIIVGDGTVIRTKGTNWVYWMHSNEGSQASKVTNSLCRATGTTVFAMAFGGTALPAAPSLLSYSTPTLKLGLIKFGVGSTADVLAQTAGNPKQPINWWSAGVNGLGAAFNLNPFTTAAAASSFKRESSGDYSLNNFDNFFWSTMNNGISGHLLNTGGFNPAKFEQAKDVTAMQVFNLLPSFWGNAASNVATDYLVPEK